MNERTLSESLETIDSATTHPSARSGMLINCQLLYLLSGVSAVSTTTSAICAKKSKAKRFIRLFTHTPSLFTSHLFLPNSFFKKRKKKKGNKNSFARCWTLFQTLNPKISPAFGSSLPPRSPGEVSPKAGLQISGSKGGKEGEAKPQASPERSASPELLCPGPAIPPATWSRPSGAAGAGPGGFHSGG